MRGKGLWKFNNSLLYDLEYSNIVKKKILEVKILQFTKFVNILSGKRKKSSRACLKGVFFLQVYRCKSGKSSLKGSTRDFGNERYLLCGDFNLVLCPHIDCYNYLHVNNPNARDKFLEIVDQCLLIVK
jgi:hypothetical protein